jgi:hypothetical protein
MGLMPRVKLFHTHGCLAAPLFDRRSVSRMTTFEPSFAGGSVVTWAAWAPASARAWGMSAIGGGFGLLAVSLAVAYVAKRRSEGAAPFVS